MSETSDTNIVISKSPVAENARLILSWIDASFIS